MVKPESNIFYFIKRELLWFCFSLCVHKKCTDLCLLNIFLRNLRSSIHTLCKVDMTASNKMNMEGQTNADNIYEKWLLKNTLWPADLILSRILSGFTDMVVMSALANWKNICSLFSIFLYICKRETIMHKREEKNNKSKLPNGVIHYGKML